ncbi:MAG: PQQ-dependent sugar dehydrogenase [Chitinophagaceae bacterium]
MRVKIFVLVLSVASVIMLSAFLFSKKEFSPLESASFVVDTVAQNLIVPWEIIFLPDKTMLFSERSGQVRVYKKGNLLSKPILTVKEINTTRKQGLLGLCIHPEFVKNKYIYIAYNYQHESGAFLRIVRYLFVNDTLISPKVIVENILANPNHTGCRLKFGPDKKLYITTGDADRPALAQDLKSLNGKILRVNDDGSVPMDNPFSKNDTAQKQIWTYGHRNPQGIDFQPGTGYLFSSEHGPSGGDEINWIRKGKNYGWPVIHHRDTMANKMAPLLEYTPSIGPSAALFYQGRAFPDMKGNLLVACLRGESIIRIELDKQKILRQQVLLKSRFGRIRALAVSPEGYIYFSTSQHDPPEGKPRPGDDLILRIRPATGNADVFTNGPTKNVGQETNVAVNNDAEKLYSQLCAECHGIDLKGTGRGQSLADGKWQYGSDRKDIINNIANGIAQKGMPAWEGAVSKEDITKIADFILRKSANK